MEMVAEAKILLVHQVCDMCGKGIMTYDFKSDQMCHVNYPHKYNKCGHVKTIRSDTHTPNLFPLRYFVNRLEKKFKTVS